MEGAGALPRLNGELVFDEPWEGRAFGIAVALNDQRVCEWSEFREHLIESIAAEEEAGAPSGYYNRWLRAMESLLLKRGLVTSAELERRTGKLASGQREDPDHHHR